MVNGAVASGAQRHRASPRQFSVVVRHVVRDGIGGGLGGRPADPEPVSRDDAEAGPEGRRHSPAGPEGRDHQGDEAGPDERRLAGIGPDERRLAGIGPDERRLAGIGPEHAGGPGLASRSRAPAPASRSC